jgi:beta-carotene/zeaxanthin 4-ketolase
MNLSNCENSIVCFKKQNIFTKFNQKCKNFFAKMRFNISDSDLQNVCGLAIAVFIILTWFLSIVYLLLFSVHTTNIFNLIFAILWQTFLYTGLFITAHDAMHGVIYEKNPQINQLIGSIAVLLYGFFSYKELRKKHWQHHHHPAADGDPDYHDDTHTDFLGWYLNFMKNYYSWSQLFSSIAVFCSLFYFGTFLTHREPLGGYTNHHHAKTIAFPIWFSFITCYHFGYHQEHHQYPLVPWWKLPMVHKNVTLNYQEMLKADFV